MAIEGHILTISKNGGYRINPAIWYYAWDIPGHNDQDSGRINFKDHVRTMFWPYRAIFWPFLWKEASGYTQQCEIWHGSSLGTLITIQDKPILRSRWGPCFGYKGPYLAISRKGGYRINPAMWNSAWNITGHNHYDSGTIYLKDNVRTMFWQ